MSEQYSTISKAELEKLLDFYGELSVEELQASLNGIHAGGSEENTSDVFDIIIIEALIKRLQGR